MLYSISHGVSSGAVAPYDATIFRQIADRCDIPTGTASATTGRTVRTRHTYYGRTPTSTLKVGFANFFLTSVTETLGDAAATIQCAIEVNGSSGVYSDFLFSGSSTVTPGAASNVISDALSIGFTLTYGDTFFIRTLNIAPTSTLFMENTRGSAAGVQDEWALTGNFLHGGEGVGVRAGGFGLWPGCILAQSGYPAWASIGDSMIWGQNETKEGDGTTGHRGWNSKWISKLGYGHIRMGKTGDKALNAAGSGRAKSYALMKAAGLTHLHVGYGDNDLANSQTRAQTITSLKGIATKAKDPAQGNVVKCTISTLTPHVTQIVANSDWTQANQADPVLVTWVGATEWAATNDQIRAFTNANSGYDMVLEVADACTPSRNSNFWQDNRYGVVGAGTSDGVHAVNGTFHQGICDSLPTYLVV